MDSGGGPLDPLDPPMTLPPWAQALPEPPPLGKWESRPLVVSNFTDAADKTPKAELISWDGFVRTTMDGHGVVDIPAEAVGYKAQEKVFKARCPLFSPAEFRSNGRQTTADVIQVHLGVLDLDHISPDQLAEFLFTTLEKGLALLCYTGWSHGLTLGATDYGPGDNRSMRAIVPLSRAVGAHEWAAFWPRFNHYLGGYGDPQCKNPDRAYFVPVVPRARKADAEVRYWPGQPLDVDALLRSAAPDGVAYALAAGPGTHKVGRAELEAFRTKLAKKNPTTAAALAKVLQGEPWAEPGQRDNTLYQLAGDIAKAFPRADAASIALVFAPSVSHFTTPGGGPGEFTLDHVTQKLQAHQARALQEQERKEITTLEARKANTRRAFRSTRDFPYTMDECIRDAESLAIPLDEIPYRWIIQHQGAMYIRVGDHYEGPIPPPDQDKAVNTFLAPAISLGVRLEEMTLTGEFVNRSAKALSMEYGVIATGSVVDMKAQRTHYRADSGVVVEAPCPMRTLEPTYSHEVATWLRQLAGTQADALELWLAYATDLDKPCAALFLEGPPGTGKSLLAKGVAHLWTDEQPTTLEQAMGAFNSALAKCPLVFADETMPKDFRGRARTAELRELIQSDSRPLKRKFLPDTTVKGAIRVIVAANNRHILDGEESLTPWDVAAIIGRIVHIECQPGATEYLRRLGWAPGQGREDTIARHVLWLRDNVERPKVPSRFLVESNAAGLHRSITTGTVLGSAVAHWLVSWLLDPMRLRSKPPGDSGHLVRVKGGMVHANSRALTDHWDAYRTNVPVEKATARNISAGIKSLSDTPQNNRVPLEVPGFGEERPRFYTIRTADLCEWAASSGVSTTEEILGAIYRLDDDRAIPPTRK